MSHKINIHNEIWFQFETMIFCFVFSYFTDPDVLNRIPYLFLLLGGCFIVLQVIAIILMREPTPQENQQIAGIL